MIFGVVLLFSVSTTLKVCFNIMTHQKIMSRVLLDFIFTKLNNSENNEYKRVLNKNSLKRYKSKEQ